MNIKQALKKKNILVDQIKQEFSRLNSYNSFEVDNKRAYDPRKCLDNYVRLTNELIDLKTAIHKANQPIYDKIFKLSEYKSMVKYLKALNCSEGKIAGNQWRGDSERITVAEIGIVERDTMVANYEELINKLQDELDYHNQVTEI